MKINEIHPLENTTDGTPMEIGQVRAGFPSPATDYTGDTIDLNRTLIPHPATTFCARAVGESMKDAGISSGDLLIIDKSLAPTDGKIAVCFVDGEFTLKRLKKGKDCLFLMPANEQYPPIRITQENDFRIWGILTHVIKSF